jgi:hypothetical protein
MAWATMPGNIFLKRKKIENKRKTLNTVNNIEDMT